MVNNLAKQLLPQMIDEADIQKPPVKWCSIALTEIISRGKRLEASVFDIEAKSARLLVTAGKYPFAYLQANNGLIKDAYYPGRFKRTYCDYPNGTAFYLPSQMNEIQPKAEKYISKLTKCDIPELQLKRDTLLLTRSGTIGNVAIVSRTLEGKVFSDDVIRISFRDQVDLGYVFAYLRTPTGNSILLSNGYGSVITHLEPEHLSKIPVPNPPKNIKQRIHDLVMHSFALRDESNDLIDKATEILIDEMRLPPIQDIEKQTSSYSSDINSFPTKLSDIDGRLDASYHVPIVNAIITHLKGTVEEVTTIGDERISKEITLPGRFKRVYVNESYGRVFIGGKQLYELDPSNKKYLSPVFHGDRITKQLELHENMILITCSGTIGKVALVPKQWENWTANQHIIRIIPSSNEIAGYIFIFLSSQYGYPLITHFTYGSVVDEIDDKHVAKVAIPLLKNKDVQQRINNLALEANEKRYQAYKLEQEAIEIMNSEVLGL